VRSAVRVIAAGARARVDAGEVNGRVFLNNVSLGVHPAFVEARGDARRGPRLIRWARLLWAALRVVRRFPNLLVHITIDGRQFRRISPAILVGNNEYRLDAPGAGSRASLTQGQLSLVITRRRGPRGLLMQALRAAGGRLRGSHDLDELCGKHIEVRTPWPTIRVTIDGEIVHMKPPLVCRVREGALTVIVPKRPT
jgi:diacylglycerol kinase family enzyme